MRDAALSPHRLAPGHPLGIGDVAIGAVANNPDL